jgi:aminopeptidase YwaD
LFAGKISAQDKNYAKSVIDTLSSRYFAGRGYVEDGDLKAARFIVNKFRAIGLSSFGDAKDYIQPFVMPVNTFPGKMLVKINDKLLTPGKDYIVDPVSGGSRKQTLDIVFLDSLKLSRVLQGEKIRARHKKFAFAFRKKDLEFAIKEGGFEKITTLHPLALISINDGRLVWSVSAIHIDIPFIEIKKSAYDGSAASITLQVDEVQKEHHTQNVIGYIKGSVYPDSFIFITAHYDHLGMMGQSAYFPGANDNASGIAMMLDMARYFSGLNPKPRYSIAFIAFAGEEAGLVGSKYYNTYPLVPLKQISFLINMDLMANGQDGMMVVNGAVFPKEYGMLVHINDSAKYLKVINKRGKAANSDHYWFSENGVRAIFVYLLGEYPYYHDIYDTADKPTLAGYDGAFRLLRDFVLNFGH